MEFICRASIRDDFDSIYELLKQLWPDKGLSKHALSTVYSRSIDSNHDFLLSAVLNGEVIGFGCMVIKNSFWQESFVGYLTTLIVHEEHRNLGVGKQLIEKLENIAKEKGCKRIELDSGFHRERAHQVYEHLGFHKRAFLFSKELV
ncbi:GNAT family N-acetyltransferase [Paenibacillus nanensis]|uniref:GNAT family N-acetyltransferase n=1 Tax=Paenibacillus nanensis TaxID=393251 RepID=A0A3A1UYT4_9BACL|nr:GNAT family N-acetyltransferase [Paenibacillus nanensis]RIX53667.1 GNAT family N-acetyltransferase [Paenibacillus nanensis]